MRCLFLEGLLLVSVTGDSASKSLKGEEAIIRGAQGFWGRGRHRGPTAGGTWGPWQEDAEGRVEWTVARIQGAGGGVTGRGLGR